MAMRLLFTVSDHGYGHATRTVALLREALSREHSLAVRIVSGPRAGEFLARSFRGEPRVGVGIRPSDPGLLLSPESLRVDPAQTTEAWGAWMDSWEEWIEAEQVQAARTGLPDAVLSDGTPPALILAARLGVPGLLLGNFAWSDILARLLPAGMLSRIRDALALATVSLAYPFALPFEGLPRPEALPLVARRPGRSRDDVRRSLGVDPAEPLVFLSSGLSSDPRLLWDLAPRLRARALVASHAPELPGAVRIPAGDTEGQDYIGASDLIVGKVGYGTLSEALVAGVPMIMVRVEGTPEVAALEAGMIEAGAGVGCDPSGDILTAARQWLRDGARTGRPYRAEDCAGAAKITLEKVRSLARRRA